MELKDILPLIVPGIIMQVLIQAYYIKHCWENKRLNQKQKTIFIVAIAVFNILAAAVYLFTTREKNTEAIEDLDHIEIDSQIRQGVFALLLAAFEIFSLRIIYDNTGTEYYSLIIGLLAACFITLIAYGLIVKRQHRFLYYILPALQILLILPVEYLDNTLGAPFIVLVVVAGIINQVGLRSAKMFSAAAFILYAAVLVAKIQLQIGNMDENEIVSYIYINLLVFALVFAAFYSLKKQLLANQQLETALKRLKEQSLQLQEMSAVEERNRITGEIHDTVGHTLTSAVIAIEAGEKLLASDRQAALGKFAIAKEQVKRGLGDIRNSVKTVHTGGDKDFSAQLTQFIHETRQNTGLAITKIVELQSDLLPIQKRVLFMALKECVTNSIKHGNSKEVDILLQEHKGIIRLTISDNGTGTDHLSYGFGLTTMQERIRSIGGTLSANSADGEGFTVSISIPAGSKSGGEQA